MPFGGAARLKATLSGDHPFAHCLPWVSPELFRREPPAKKRLGKDVHGGHAADLGWKVQEGVLSRRSGGPLSHFRGEQWAWAGQGERRLPGGPLHENSAAAPWVGQAGPASLCSVQLKESCRAEGPGCSGRGHGLHHTWLKYTDY